MAHHEQDKPPAWFTEAQRGTWKVGDEVVVTLGECKIGYHHGTEEYGARGTVMGLEGVGSSDPEHHPIWVIFRRPLGGIHGDGRGRKSWWYGPGELRPDDTLAQILKEHANADRS